MNGSQEDPSQPTQEIRISQVSPSTFEPKTNPWGIIIHEEERKELIEKEYLIGRGTECTLKIEKKDISRAHCKITFEKGNPNTGVEDEAFLVILSSQKIPATFIGDRPVCVFFLLFPPFLLLLFTFSTLPPSPYFFHSSSFSSLPFPPFLFPPSLSTLFISLPFLPLVLPSIYLFLPYLLLLPPLFSMIVIIFIYIHVLYWGNIFGYLFLGGKINSA